MSGQYNEKESESFSTTVPLQDMTERRDQTTAPAYSAPNYSGSNPSSIQTGGQYTSQVHQHSALRNPYDTNAGYNENTNTSYQGGHNPYSNSSSTNIDDEEKFVGGVDDSGRNSHDEQQNDGTGRTRSMRSFFSGRRSRSTGRRSHDNHDQEMERQTTNVSESGSKRLLPIEEDTDEEEELPDIKEVVEELKEDEASGGGGARRRGHYGLASKGKKKSRPNKVVAKLRHVYVDLLSKTLFTRSLVYWLPLALILFIPLAVGAWGAPEAEVGGVRIMWLFIWLEILWGSLWISRFVAHVCPRIFSFFVGIISPSWKKFSTVLVAVESALTLVFWALISMCTFMPIMTQNPHAELGPAKGKTQDWQSVIQNILVSLMISSLVYLAERLLIHFLSVSFHKTRFAKRIKDNKLAIRVLAQLLDAAYMVFPPFCPEFEMDDLHMQAGTLMTGKQLPGNLAKKIVNSNNVTQVVGNLNRVVGGAAKVIGNVGRDIRGGTANSISAYNTVIDALANRHVAETLGRRIWMSLVLEGADELTIDDLVEVLGEPNRKDAEAVFEVLDSDGNGNLTLEEMVASVQQISKERKTIFRSLRDVDSAIGKLHNVLLFVVVIIMVIIFIGMLAPSVSAVLATLGTSLLAFSFVFSPTAQEILGSCVFLFVKHPFDVGDIVCILTPDGPTRMTVVEISLLFTVFSNLATALQTQASNAVLNNLWIDNITRTGCMATMFTLNLGMPETSLEDIDRLKEKLDQFLEENSRDYLPDPYFAVTDMPDLDQLSLCIIVTFKSNQHDGTLYGMRRTRMYQFLGQCVHDIPLHVPRRSETYNNAGLPIVIQDMPFGRSGAGGENDGDEGNDGKPKTVGARPAMGIRPVAPPTFEFDQASSAHGQQPQGQNIDTTHLSAADGSQAHDTARSSALNRMSSLASRTSSLSRSRTTTGMRKKN